MWDGYLSTAQDEKWTESFRKWVPWVPTYKNRMAIAAKGKSKSGGARVITYNIQKTADDEIVITLMTIYDKSDIANVSDAYLRSLVKLIAK